MTIALALAAAIIVLLSVAWWADHSVLVGKLRLACPHDPAEVRRYYGDAAMGRRHRWCCTNCGLRTGPVAGPEGWERRYGMGREKA